VTAGGVRDRRQHQAQRVTVQSGDVVTEVDHRLGGADRGGDPQQPLLAPGQCTDQVAEPGEVDPVAVLAVASRSLSWPAGEPRMVPVTGGYWSRT
jgi:hypothetical protein